MPLLNENDDRLNLNGNNHGNNRNSFAFEMALATKTYLRMRKIYLVLIAVGILAVGVLIYLYGKSNVIKYDFLIERALKLYNQKKVEGMEFNSQCLGTIEGINGVYAVDIVHVPRTAEDNLAENQCEAYRNGSVTHFIELDKDGNVVRVV